MYSSGSMFLCIQNRKTNSHKWEFVKVLYCSHFSQIHSLSYPECLHFQQRDCCTQNPKNVSFSSSYNKTHKTYWREMLLLSSAFINSLLHKLPNKHTIKEQGLIHMCNIFILNTQVWIWVLHWFNYHGCRDDCKCQTFL